MSAQATSRADDIADAAAVVFQRYGLRKASMDDLAAAAGLSRQGLYLHFKTKEALFQASLRRILRRQQEAVSRALVPDDRALFERLSAALDYLHGEYTVIYHGTTAELIEAAATLGQSLLNETTQIITRELATALTDAGVADRWHGASVTSDQLASLLLSAVVGSAQLYPDDNDSPSRLRTILTVVLAGSPS
ncbi:TetR/AcrR family transcriptional regulator [Actinoplanes regularis]|uniref:TetR/AcrR family transcriptional regulator n=1 Tax=Actinoplanes regularis TaxID=52697 RepID=UPI0024A4AC40|nr:TetR/AcrR family transcriptional regulator [Actinoplanes regularis]GLW33771.1 hypothetical protein Areg01_67090 [Actinoplanes regularis]